MKSLIGAIVDLFKTIISTLTYHSEQWFWRNKTKPKEVKHFADGFHEGRWEDDEPIRDIHGKVYDPKKMNDKQYDFAEDDEEILGI